MTELRCRYCHGKHPSEYCPGYHHASLAVRTEEIGESITELSLLGRDAVERLSEGLGIAGEMGDSMSELAEVSYETLGAISEGFDGVQQAQEEMAASVTEGSHRIADAVSDTGIEVAGAIDRGNSTLDGGFRSLNACITEGASAVAGGLIVGAAIFSAAIAGVGAVLMYRERMDALRHRESLEFQEDSSDAGRARRELLTASALIFAGDHVQAGARINRSIDLYPSSAESFRLLSITQDLDGSHDQACVSLKAALKLAEGGHFSPALGKERRSSGEAEKEGHIVAIVGQLAHELALIGKAEDAVKMARDHCGQYPDNRDLHFLTMRMLAKSALWDREAASHARMIVTRFPDLYNLVYMDAQMGERLPEAQELLREVNNDVLRSVRGREHVLMLLTGGKSTRSPKGMEELPFAELMKRSAEIEKLVSDAKVNRRA